MCEFCGGEVPWGGGEAGAGVACVNGHPQIVDLRTGCLVSGMSVERCGICNTHYQRRPDHGGRTPFWLTCFAERVCVRCGGQTGGSL